MATGGAATSGWPPYLDPMAWAQWVRAWTSPASPASAASAPQSLSQPILPGWIFGPVTINEANSALPRAEWDILQQYSYGRQLGRMADVLQQLIERSGADVATQPFKDFLEMKDVIDRKKDHAKEDRLEALREEIAKLTVSDRDQLRRLLDEPPR